MVGNVENVRKIGLVESGAGLVTVFGGMLFAAAGEVVISGAVFLAGCAIIARGWRWLGKIPR